MQCNQCELGAGQPCVRIGACGKPAEIGDRHDALFLLARDVAQSLRMATGAARAARDRFLEDALFATMTSVNYDPLRLAALHEAGQALRPAARATVVRLKSRDPDIAGMQEMLAGALKGLAAILRQARPLGHDDPEARQFLAEALADLDTPPRSDAVESLLERSLHLGGIALRAMGLLDAGHRARLGNPGPAAVRMGHVPGRAILVSGHELDQLAALLDATAGRGLQVYTHGEMLAGHGYPGIRRHPHLAGHYGGAWHDQQRAFARFPGAIVMTGSCLTPPAAAYRDRMFTTGAMAHPELQHLAAGDFGPAIKAALAAPGFTDRAPERWHTVGFGQHATSGVIDGMADAVRQGQIRRFVLIGGCDGPGTGRHYYSELAEALPDDWAVLTLGCGKFRVLGRRADAADRLPRLLDVGQCSDTFAAIKIAHGLAQRLDLSPEQLPLSMVISWHEQKAITILLSLLHLGFRDIRIGPRLPGYVTPGILSLLNQRFGLRRIGTVHADVVAMAAA